jgi:hypothetical protein
MAAVRKGACGLTPLTRKKILLTMRDLHAVLNVVPIVDSDALKKPDI